MYEQAKELIASRQAILQHDRELLDLVPFMEGFPEKIWKALSEIHSDTTRFFACREYLAEQFPDAVVENGLDGRIKVITQTWSVSFPGKDSEKQCITVEFPDYPDMLTAIAQPVPVLQSDRELAVAAYTEAAKSGKAGWREQADLRMAIENEGKKAQEKKSGLLWFAIIRLGDYMSGRGSYLYWEHLVESLAQKRNKESNDKTTSWMKAQGIYSRFQTALLPQLQEFGFPVCIRCGQRFVGMDAFS